MDRRSDRLDRRVDRLADLAALRGHKWDGHLLLVLAARGPLRYSRLAGELRRLTNGELSDAQIGRTLQDLTRRGLVRKAAGDRDHDAHELTEAGVGLTAKLTAVLDILDAWQHPHGNGEAGTPG